MQEQKVQLKKKGYNVKCVDDTCSIAVVATTNRDAKKIGFVRLDCDWIDVRATQAKDADVEDLSIGIIDDAILAWRRGIYNWLTDYTETTCDGCHKEPALYRIGRQIYCENCYKLTR